MQHISIKIQENVFRVICIVIPQCLCRASVHSTPISNAYKLQNKSVEFSRDNALK
jgi:hypothetical protein